MKVVVPGGEVHVLIPGHNAKRAAEAASQVAGVAKVLLADAPRAIDYQFLGSLRDV